MISLLGGGDQIVWRCRPDGWRYVVKQKFGSLRFYTDTAGSSTQEALIDLAMRLSLRMCEVCGARAREHCRDDGKGLTGWTLVRCDVHAEGFTRQGIGKQ